MTFFPDPSTIVTIGGFSIRWFALTLIAGCLIAYLAASAQMKQHGYRQSTMDDILPITMFSGFVGGRIVWVLENYGSYRLYLWDALEIFDGGVDFVGACLFIALALLLYTKYKQMSWRRTMDVVMPAMLLVSWISKIGRAMTYPKTFMVIGAEILIFLALVYYVRKYRPGRKRGDVTAFFFMLEGLLHVGAMVMGYDLLSSNCTVICILAEIFGIALYAYNRRTPHNKPVILFDFDGTIMDSERMVIGIFAYMFQKYGSIEDFTKEKQEHLFDLPLQQEIIKLFPDEDPDTLMKDYRDFQKSLPGRHLVTMMPHVKEVIHQLHRQGYMLGIVTTRLSESCEMWLEDLEIEDYFSIVTGTERYRHAKPEPDGIIRTCELLKTGHDSVIYIGDNASDIQAGINAGVYTIGYSTEDEKLEKLAAENPNKVINDLMELLEIVHEDHAWSNEMI